MTKERLFGWHAALFPTGYSGLSKIRVGVWRDDAKGPMQVVSGPSAQIQRERKSHYGARERTQKETMDVTEWLAWFFDTLHRALEDSRTPDMPLGWGS